MLRTLLTRLAALTVLSATAASAQSGCTALYATINYGTASAPLVAIDYVNTISHTSSQVYDQTLANAGITNINAAGLNPVNGQVYFIDRSVAGRNDLYAFNPVTLTSTFKGPISVPTAANSVAIGGTFDNSTGTARYYVLYGSYLIQEVNPETGAVLRTITVNFPATDAQGATLTRRTANSSPGTSGDIVFNGPTAFAVLDGVGGGTNLTYWANLGALSAQAGNITVTPTPADMRRILNGGTPVPQGAVNGASITPYGETYISYTTNTTTYNLATLNTTGAASVSTTTVTTNGTRAYTDLSDCTVLPSVPTVSKAFSASTIRTGQNATLTLTLRSSNPSPSYTQAPLTDTLPAGVTVASTPNVSTTCTNSQGAAATITAAPNSGTVTIASGTRVPHNNTTCTVTVTVTGTSRGQKTNTIPAGSLRTTAGTYNTAASANLLVNDPVSATIVKQQRIVPIGAESPTTLSTAPVTARPGRTVEYCLTATHGGEGYADATRAVLGDSLDNNLELVPNVYNGNASDVRIQRGTNPATFAKFATTFSPVTTGGVTKQTLSVDILPFNASNPSVTVCFQARVR